MNVQLQQNHSKIYQMLQFELKKIRLKKQLEDLHKEQHLKDLLLKINQIYKKLMKDPYQKYYRKESHHNQLNSYKIKMK